MQLKIIDVSKYQANIDYAKTAKNIDGVILKIGGRGWGTGSVYKDPMFEKHLNGFYNAGVRRIGVYFFSQAVNTLEATQEADFCIKTLSGVKNKITFPIFFDSEFGNNGKGRADKLGKTDRTFIAIAFMTTVEQAGYSAGIYASTYWFRDNLDDSKLKNRFIHWVADYRGKNGYGSSEGWQYTDANVIPGIIGKVDTSYFYTDFYKKTASTAPTSQKAPVFAKGQAVKLTKANLYASQDSTTPAGQLTGTYYIYDGKLMHLGRYRITNHKDYCGKGTKYITGYVAYPNFKSC